LAVYQRATDEDGGDDFGRTGEEGLGEGWVVLDGLGDYGGGFVAM